MIGTVFGKMHSDGVRWANIMNISLHSTHQVQVQRSSHDITSFESNQTPCRMYPKLQTMRLACQQRY